MRTDVVGGMRFEAGANGSDQQARLSTARARLRPRRPAAAQFRRHADTLRHADRLHRLPSGPRDFFATDLLMAAELRALCEPFVSAAPADRDETVREFGDRRLGAGVSPRLSRRALASASMGRHPTGSRCARRSAYCRARARARQPAQTGCWPGAAQGAAWRVDRACTEARRAVRAARGNRPASVALVDRRPGIDQGVSGASSSAMTAD